MAYDTSGEDVGIKTKLNDPNVSAKRGVLDGTGPESKGRPTGTSHQTGPSTPDENVPASLTKGMSEGTQMDDEDQSHNSDKENMTVSAKLAGLNLQDIESSELDGDDYDFDDDDSVGNMVDRSYDLDDDFGSHAGTNLDDSHNLDADDEEEAEQRRKMDADLEMNLRRAELRHVELELKLVSAEEEVRKAKEALKKAEADQQEMQRQAHDAWEEVGEAERLIQVEQTRREEEDAAKALAERQARAIIEADELRQQGNEAYRQGNSEHAETYYKRAIDELESCGIVLEEPSHLTLRTNRAAALMALGHTRDAFSECELVLEINPYNIRALSRAANCCIKLGDLVAAKKYVDEIGLSPDATDEDINAASEQNQKILVASVERDRLVGNESYRRGDYSDALHWYDAALNAAADAVETDALKSVKVGLHTNRAAAYLMEGNPLPAAEDCCAALRLDSTHTKAQVRLARCLLQLGDFSEARQEASDVIARNSAELQSKNEARNVLKDVDALEGTMKTVGDELQRIQMTLQTGDSGDDYDASSVAVSMLDELETVMVIAPQVPDLITLKAEALRLAGKAEQALSLVTGKKAINSRRRFIEVRLQFDLGNVSACVEAGEHVRELLQIVPEFKLTLKAAMESKVTEDDENIKELASLPDPEGLLILLEKASKINTCKDNGREAFVQGKHSDAAKLYGEALVMSAGAPMLEGLFLSNICACEQAMSKYADALSSAGTAVAIAPTFVKAHSRLATLYTELGMLTEAEAAYRRMLEMPLESHEEVQASTNLASVSARAKNNRPVDWYKLLGIKPSASATDIKKAYRQLALVHHPDKAGRGGVSAAVAKARAEMSSILFKHVGEAQRVLTNPAERSKWETARAREDHQDSYSSRAHTTARSDSGFYADPFGDRYGRYSADFYDEYEDFDDGGYYGI
jgi:DnaJ family protein C protein 7